VVWVICSFFTAEFQGRQATFTDHGPNKIILKDTKPTLQIAT